MPRFTLLFMLSFKRVGRILMLTILIVMASFGIALFGVQRDPYVKNENPIEMVVKKEDEEETEEREIKD